MNSVQFAVSGVSLMWRYYYSIDLCGQNKQQSTRFCICILKRMYYMYIIQNTWAQLPFMMHNSSFAHRMTNASLYIESARGYDEGVYTCVASNTLGQSRNSSVLRVAGNIKLIVGTPHTSQRTTLTAGLMAFYTPMIAEWLSPSSSPVSPIIVNFTGVVSSTVGMSVDLPCHAVGILPINYTWSRGKVQARSSTGLPGDRYIGGEWK